jgi:hypothetical protein
VKQLARLAALIVCASLIPTARAAQPFTTDDAEPADKGHGEIYIADTLTWSRESYNGTLPYAEFEYGPIQNVEVDLLTPVAFNQSRFGGSFECGYGDTELGFRWQFVHADEFFKGCPEIATAPFFVIPTGNARLGLGNGGAQEFAPIVIEENWGEENRQWTSYAEAGYGFNAGGGNLNYGFVGVVLQKQLTDALALGGEVFHFTPSARDDGEHTGFNLGGSYQVSPSLAFLFSAGRDFIGDNRLTTFVGVEWSF